MKLILALLLALCGALVSAQDEMMMAPMPTKEMDAISFMNGSWEGEMTMFEMDGSTMKMKATIKGSRVLGGRFLQTMHTMKMEGMPMTMEGMQLMTYDPEKKEYVGTWFDGMAPHSLEFRGKMDGNKIVMMGMMKAMPGMPQDTPARTTWTKKSDKEYTFLLEFQVEGAWNKILEGQFTKKS